jgi:SAP domain
MDALASVFSDHLDTLMTVCSGHPAKPDFTHAIDKALAAPAQPEKKALPLVTASLDELRAMPVKQLKQLLTERHLPIAGLSEKQDLVEAVDKQCRTVTYYG